MSTVKKWLYNIITDEGGQALPIVLVLLTLGGLLIIPGLNYSSTSLKAGKIVEEKFKGFYAAECGVEDALWKLKNDAPDPLPHSYELTGIDAMSVDVTIERTEQIAGEDVENSGVHEGWLKIDKIINYASGNYSYILSVTNNGGGNMKVEKILIDFPPDVDYAVGSTSGNITFDDPTKHGNSVVGITLVWDIPSPYFTVAPGTTENHAFQLNGPPDVEGIEGHSFVRATRDDVGTVWDSDSKPYTITAQARDSTGKLLATIRAGVWKGAGLEISCWSVNP